MNFWRRNAPPVPAAAPLVFTSVARTHVGKVRLLNEDRFLDCPERGLWAVADGMGGHSAGDVAATMAIRALSKLTAAAEPISLRGVTAALEAANADIRTGMGQRGQTGGSTVAGLWLDSGKAHAFWLGDSRVYRFRAGCLAQLTHDHSVVQQLVDEGLIDPINASKHPQANVITRALGVADHMVIDTSETEICHGDQFLICSDGVSNEITDEEIERQLRYPGNDLTEGILSKILSSGARDNLTFILIAST